MNFLIQQKEHRNKCHLNLLFSIHRPGSSQPNHTKNGYDRLTQAGSQTRNSKSYLSHSLKP